MPTGSKLTGFVCFGFLAWFTAGVLIGTFDEPKQTGYMPEIVAVLGALAGWRVMGPRTGDGYNGAAGAGLTTSAVMTVWSVFTFALYEMIVESTKMRYDGPMQAIIGMFELCIEYGMWLISPEVIGTLVVGGIICGFITEFIGKRWA
ncbi:MAG: TrgA family protein [Rhodobacteraceae bacterium]|nr:TrgA family protein [Paracoccaceae bacterium]